MGGLLVGSDAMTVVATSEGFPWQQPTGVRHAVLDGQAVALCGVRPKLVWTGSSWPAVTEHPDELCSTCRRLSLDHVEREADVIQLRHSG